MSPKPGSQFSQKDTETVASDERDQLEGAIDCRCSSAPVLLEVRWREVDEDPWLGIEAPEERERSKHQNAEAVMVGFTA